MFGKKQAMNRKQASLMDAQKKTELAASYQSGAFQSLQMNVRNHSILTSILRKHDISVVELTTDAICYYCTNRQKTGVVMRGQLVYKNCKLGEAVYFVEATEMVENGIFKSKAVLLPGATEALEKTIGQGTLARLSFMLRDSSAAI